RLDILIIGKLFSPAALGYYTRAQSLEQIVKNYSSQSLRSVLLSALSRLQHKPAEFNSVLKKYVRIAVIFSLLISGGLFVTAEEIIILLFSDQWLPSVLYFKILIVATFTYPICALINSALEAGGNVSRSLKLELYRKLILILAYPIGFYWGIEGFLYAWICYRFIDLAITLMFSQDLFVWDLNYLFKSIILPFILTLASCVLLNGLELFDSFSLIEAFFLQGFAFFALFVLIFYFPYKMEIIDFKKMICLLLKPEQ
ncbi:oligosaccharide flippase family protein, partial [Fulvivirga lutimaris]|uniref:oligosaccharide flippase family protein n=1 Tax=Fulvivirga lutimaris TaxID=1819566 RepID=UPI0012BB5DEB